MSDPVMPALDERAVDAAAVEFARFLQGGTYLPPSNHQIERTQAILAAYFAALDPPLIERAAQHSAAVRGNRRPTPIDRREARAWLEALGLFIPDTEEPSPMANDISITFTREELAALDRHLRYEPMEYTPLGYAVLQGPSGACRRPRHGGADVSRTDEYGWKDRDDCRGRVIGYEEVRLEQPDCPADAAAMIDVGEPPRNGTVWANPVYLTAEQAVDVALTLLDAAAMWRACRDDDGPPAGPVPDDDHDRRWRLHVHAASIADCTFWVERHGEGWKATEVETGVTGALGPSVEDAMTNYLAGRVWGDSPLTFDTEQER